MPQQRSSLSRYFDLVLYKTYADLRAESARTYVGFLWWIVEPALNMCVLYLVFGVIMKRGTEDFVPFLFAGVVPWRWFATAVNHGASSIVLAKSLMLQVDLPKLVFPIVSVLTDSVKFLVVFVVLLMFLWLYGFGVGPDLFSPATPDGCSVLGDCCGDDLLRCDHALPA